MQRQGRLLGERPVALHRRRSRSPAPLGLILALALAGAPSAHAAEGPRAREGFSSASAAAFAPGGASSLDLRAAAVLGGDSAAPTVTLAPVALVSSYSTPAFSGAASDSTPVTVSVYEGASAEGEPVATLQAPVQAGSWSSSEVSPPLGAGLYTAVAREPSSLGGPTGASREVSFEINPGAPALTLSSPPSRSHNTSPSFAGKSSEGGEVTVEVFEGTRPAGPLFAVLKASVAGGSWSTEPVSPALPQGRHTFTAVAVQAGAISKVTGRSAPVTFAVDTEPPTVTLTLPQSPSNHTTPAFSGTSSEAGEVTVQVYAGSSAAGTPIASATASPPAGGGGWTTKPAQPALGEGTFTAVATQQSGLGNPAGTSAPVTFVVDTSSPTVTINAPVSPSANRVPSFSGSASDRTPVSVEVYAGARPEGAVVASATAEAGGGRWVSAKASPALAWGAYTAVATQPSSIQNPTGTSAAVSFAVQPIAPTAATEAATDVTRTSAALYALVNPNAAGVSSCSFEYGATPTYGRSVECGFVSGAGAFPPAGTSAVAVFVRIYGLAPATGYHFRIVAVGEGGTAQGSDATFTTQPPWLFGEQARGGVSASRSVPAAGEIAALIARAMSPRGRAASITALLASGAFKTTLEVGETGSALVDWFYLPRAARRAGERTHPPVLVAAATLTLRGNEAVALKVRLSSAGKRLLRAARRMRLTATCTFTPAQGSPGESAATFELHR